MPYRICKSFEVESGHRLMKHPDRCRFPHGHTRRVEIVLAAERLDENDMVCDFKAVKLAVRECVDALDHAMALNSDDPYLETIPQDLRERIVLFQGTDPTTEVLARHVYDHVARCLKTGGPVRDEEGREYRFPPGVRVERVRISETSSSWAEYAPD